MPVDSKPGDFPVELGLQLVDLRLQADYPGMCVGVLLPGRCELRFEIGQLRTDARDDRVGSDQVARDHRTGLAGKFAPQGVEALLGGLGLDQRLGLERLEPRDAAKDRFALAGGLHHGRLLAKEHQLLLGPFQVGLKLLQLLGQKGPGGADVFTVHLLDGVRTKTSTMVLAMRIAS